MMFDFPGVCCDVIPVLFSSSRVASFLATMSCWRCDFGLKLDLYSQPTAEELSVSALILMNLC